MSLADEVLLGIAESFEEAWDGASPPGTHHAQAPMGPRPVETRRGREGE